MVTLGREAAEDPGFVADLADRGADIVRINCGHDDVDVWRRMIENTRAAARARPLRVLMDIAGPKVRMKQVITPPDRRTSGSVTRFSSAATSMPGARTFRSSRPVPPGRLGSAEGR